MQRIGVIGSGFAGLAAAAVLAKAGRGACLWKNEMPAAEPRLSCCRLHFRYGSFLVLDARGLWRFLPILRPYYCWFYDLTRLDPSIRWCLAGWWGRPPSRLRPIAHPLWKHRKGQCSKLDQFLEEAEYKYKTGMQGICLETRRVMVWVHGMESGIRTL